MARQKSRKVKFKLAPNHIDYLSKCQSEWYTAKATRSTAQFIRKKRRRIAGMLEEVSGETMGSSTKASIEDAIASWFKANCRPRGRVAKTGTKARSGREVFAHREWKAIAERKRELMEAANFQGDQHIGFHQQAVTELWGNLPDEQKAAYRREAVEWDNVAPPPEIQLHTAEGAADRLLQFTEDLYRQSNVRLWGMIIFRDKTGSLVKQVIDFNDRLGEHCRLDVAFHEEYEKMGFEKLFDKWMRPAYSSSSETPPPAAPTKATKDLARVDLEKNSYGEPILPNIAECPPAETSHRKWITKVFRAYVFDSYSVATGGLKKDISWTRLFSHLRRFVDESFWPERFTSDLKDPSIMKYDVIKGILAFWYNRQLDGADPVFSFSHYEDPKKEGTWIPRVPRAVIEDDTPVEVEERDNGARRKRGGDKGKAIPAEARANKGKGKAVAPPVERPDWMESPLKRIGNAVMDVGDSPPRKKKKQKRKKEKSAMANDNANGGDKRKGVDSDDDSRNEQDGDGSGDRDGEGHDGRGGNKRSRERLEAKGRASTSAIRSKVEPDGDDVGVGRADTDNPDEALDTSEDDPRDTANDEPEDAANDEPEDAANDEPEDAANDEPEDTANDEPEDTASKGPESARGNPQDTVQGPKPMGRRRNMPTTSVGLTTRAMAKSSKVQTRSGGQTKANATASSSRPRAQPRPVGKKKQGDIFDLKDSRQKNRK
ncbi:hypothetical protein CC1G_08112 [Coprinopsis cinerea okayama7|uniref:Uncharacterized protein n=1 Tax=Coprinopsis cinerea (strain Okayama-7 / 130 / ATCC MYA-4618 / FGSC 9003) TaxID=240176 RepID=A8NVJ3_COPC7|nr:hypothetical protein CC1G_08112 [Coprinopsis cinerea okayama7\|eukprot:XP_001836727.1 hypothetical protein CC1G_08112 [Coprinopsis cinerea okayama7\